MREDAATTHAALTPFGAVTLAALAALALLWLRG
jgi:hypothetical protein